MPKSNAQPAKSRPRAGPFLGALRRGRWFDRERERDREREKLTVCDFERDREARPRGPGVVL